MRTFKRYLAAFDAQNRTFSEANHRFLILLQKLENPLFLRLPHMGRGWIGIKVMRADLERDQVQCFKAEGLDDRHVFRGFQARTGNDRSGAGTYVRRTGSNSSPNWLDHLVPVEFVQQSERVAATDEDDFRLLDCARSIGNVMYRLKLEFHSAEASLRLFAVCPAIVKGIWNERNAIDPRAGSRDPRPVQIFLPDARCLPRRLRGRILNFFGPGQQSFYSTAEWAVEIIDD